MENNSRELTERVVKIALNGEYARGNNGAVLIDETSNDMVYLLSHEFAPSDFSETLSEMLSEDGHSFLYVVHKTSEAMHISKIPRGI